MKISLNPESLKDAKLHSEEVPDVLNKLQSEKKGLTADEAEKRLEE